MPDTNPTPLQTTTEERIEGKLDQLISLLDHMNRRDKWRTIGGFFRGSVLIIPTLLILLSSIYLYLYGTDLIQYLIKETTSQASQQVQNSFMDQFLGGTKSTSSSSPTFGVQDRR